MSENCEQAALTLLRRKSADSSITLIPMEAGSQIFSLHHEAGALGAWPGFGLFCLHAAVALGAGFVLINRRDT